MVVYTDKLMSNKLSELRSSVISQYESTTQTHILITSILIYLLFLYKLIYVSRKENAIVTLVFELIKRIGEDSYPGNLCYRNCLLSKPVRIHEVQLYNVQFHTIRFHAWKNFS